MSTSLRLITITPSMLGFRLSVSDSRYSNKQNSRPCFTNHWCPPKVLKVQKRLFIQMAHKQSANQIISSGKPFIVYGTAWKKELTSKFVNEAVKAGFRFIDTACQPRHYNEAGVGEGWSSAADQLSLERSDFYLQTKFTSKSGQDLNNIPYDPKSPLPEQVKCSLEISLRNLKTTYLDSLVLHSPMSTLKDTMIVWNTMESFVDGGKVLRLGISNCYDFKLFTSLYEMARIKPSVLQNRFYSDSNFDTQLRAFCKEKGIWYQSFWTLTANREALGKQKVKDLTKAKGLPSAQTLMFAFLMSLDGNYLTPLSGTTDTKHMAEDIAVMERIHAGEIFFKSEDELRSFAKILGIPEL